LLHYISRYKAIYFLAFTLSLMAAAVELMRPWPIKVVVDYVLTDRPLPPWLSALADYLPGAEAQQGLLVWSVLAAMIIVVGGGALSLAAFYVSITLSQRLVYDLALAVFGKLQRHSLTYHSQHPLGDLLQRVSQD
jgi:ATP-binding cassette subfamily B protein/subfamily B ATP-binding cassette protein MsbA